MRATKEKYEETIIDHGVIRSTADLNKLDIIDWTRYSSWWRDPQHCLEVVTSHLKGMAFTVRTNDLFQYPEQKDFPAWRHVGDHVSAGKLFWNYFHSCFMGNLYFHDSPDFSGKALIDGGYHKFYGDIGKVSPIAMLDVMRSHEKGVYWISVSSDCQKLTILESEILVDRERIQKLSSLLTPILKRKQLTAHIMFGNVFIETPTDNIYIGDDVELSCLSVSQLEKRVNLALSGKWNYQPVPLTSSQEHEQVNTRKRTSKFRSVPFAQPSPLHPDLYVTRSLWDDVS